LAQVTGLLLCLAHLRENVYVLHLQKNKMVNLGFMELPLSGPMSMALVPPALAFGGMSAWGMLDLANFAHGMMSGEVGSKDEIKREPAISSANPLKALNLTMLATLAWMVVFYNMLFSQIGMNMCVHVLKMVDTKKVNADAMINVASRFHGNMTDHAVVFMTSLWAYALLVDAFSAGIIGFCYVAVRLVYPFMYMYQGSFNFYFEFVTQVGYACTGLLMYGVLYNATWGPNGVSPSGCKNEETGEIKDYATKIAGGCTMCAGMKAYMLGSVSLFPGLPFGPIYALLQVLAHKRWHAPKEAADAKQSIGGSVEMSEKVKGA